MATQLDYFRDLLLISSVSISGAVALVRKMSPRPEKSQERMVSWGSGAPTVDLQWTFMSLCVERRTGVCARMSFRGGSSAGC